jgi:hypothetical protein
VIAIELLKDEASASCHECHARAIAAPFRQPIYALTLPAIGMRVMLCGHHLTELSQVAGYSPLVAPLPMRLICPSCRALHIDEGEFATKPHHTHACQICGEVWRPAVCHTVGVRFLPGFRNEERSDG